MTQLTLIGVDPGIVDTGVVSIKLDSLRETLQVTTQVWSDVTEKNGHGINVDSFFLDDLAGFVQHEEAENSATFTFVEGYRPRGRDMIQDRKMSILVQTINHTLKGSKIVDNTGIKKVVTEPLLKLFGCSRFVGTHHADLKSAARVALKGGIDITPLNRILSDYVRDNLNGTSWSVGSIQTL
jgi:hypothetical protein